MIIRGRNIIKVAGPGPGNLVTVKITFEDPPVAADVTFAAAKYNKEVVFNYEQDDSGGGLYSIVYPLFHGGTSEYDGQVSSGLTHTDGCGNPVKWKAAIACFCLNQYGVDLNSGVPGFITYDQIYTMVNQGWEVMNHQFGSPSSDTKGQSDRYQQIRDLAQRFWERMLARGKEYRIRGMVNPSADRGFTFSGLNTDTHFFSSQGASDSVRDGYTYYGDETPINELPYPNLCLKRHYLGEDFTIDFSTGYYPLFDDIIGRGTKEEPTMLRLFSHGPYPDAGSATGFRNLMNVLAGKFGDKVWACSGTELYEYLEVKNLANKTQDVEGNELTVVLNLSGVPDTNSRRDMSLLVEGGTITNIEVTGADSYTSNYATGLVNIFKKKSTGFVAPNTFQEPPRFVTATYANANLSRVKLVFNMPVTQSIASAYTLNNGFNVTALSGSGDTWYIDLNTPLPSTQGDTVVNYAGHLGNVMAVDGGNLLKGTSIFDEFRIIKE